MKSFRTAIGILVGAVVSLPAVAPAAIIANPQSQLIPVLQQIVQLQQQLIAMLRAEVAQLQSEVDALTGSSTYSQLWPLLQTPTATSTSQGTQTPPIVTASAPGCTISATPTSIQQGQSATVSWTSTNATAGSISPLGSVFSSGSQSVSPSLTTTYFGTFTGPGGTGHCSVTLTVTAVPVTTASGRTTPPAVTSCISAEGIVVPSGYTVIPADQGLGGHAMAFYYVCRNRVWFSMGLTPIGAPTLGQAYTISPKYP